MYKFNSRVPRYYDDSDYTTNAPSYYDDLARKQKLIKELSLRIWEYEKDLKESLENIEKKLNDYIEIVDGKLKIIDDMIGDGFNTVIDELLREWVKDGTLEHIINEEIFNKKADKIDLENLTDDFNKTKQIVINNNETIGIPFLELSRRKIIHELNGRFPDYNDVMAGHTDYIHPQSFTVDELNNHLFILFVPPDSSTMNHRWIAVYDWLTGEYISCFSVTSRAWEGIVVINDFPNRYLFVGDKHLPTKHNLHRYDITDLPENKSLLTDYETINLDMDLRFNYSNGKWIIMFDSETTANEGSRALWRILDDDFNVIKNINIDGEMRSLNSRKRPSTYGKVQSIAIGSNFILAGIGAETINNNNVSSRHLQQGLIYLDTNGSIIKTGIMDNKKLFNKYIEKGYNPNKVENEGIWVSKNDEIYTLTVINTSDRKGLLIYKEGTTEEGSESFQDTITPLFALNTDIMANRPFPYIDGEFRNPVNNQTIKSIREMADFMIDYSVPIINLYVTTDHKFYDINDELIKEYSYYRFMNNNDNTISVTKHSNHGIENIWITKTNIWITTTLRRYRITNDSHAIVEGLEIPLRQSINDFKRIEIAFEWGGGKNQIFTFSNEQSSFEIRTFNLSDDLESEQINIMELEIKKTSDPKKLFVNKSIVQWLDGSNSSEKKNQYTGVIRYIEGVL